MLSDGNHKLVYVPAIAVPGSPKVATELNAATSLDISCLVSLADFQLGATGEEAISDPALCATGNDTAPGRVTYEAAMNFYRWTLAAEDKAYTTFNAKGLGGFLVRRIGKLYSDAFAVGETVQVYQFISGTPMPLSPQGGYEKFRQQFYVQSQGTNERALTVT